jgi:hypothetical protein
VKVKFNTDFKDFKRGQVVDLSEAEAEDYHQAGLASPYFDEKPAPVAVPEKKPVKK